MVFSSLTFLCIFLPIVFLLYYICRPLWARNGLLIAASLLFYAYGEPVYVLLMLVSIVVNYIFGRILSSENPLLRKIILAAAVCANLGMLVVFKYADMLIASANQICNTNFPMTHLALPIGISFFTFQALSYVIDVYRNQAVSERNLLHVMLYISFFPQLIAGPIVKYHDIQAQIKNRNADIQEIAEGFRRFIIGLAKKVLISNVMAVAADALFHSPIEEINIFSAWIAAISYMFQIYFDFSGYSDMAIGLGHMFGFCFKENFQYPYTSGSIKEFWRRWHISLSTWFKEYLYIPLGGNRKGRLRTCLNKSIVFFCTGLWHGANWTFVIWGLWHGLFMLLEEVVPIGKLPSFLRRVYTLLVVCVGFVMFRADTFTQGLYMIGKMFTGFHFTTTTIQISILQLTPLFLITLLLAAVGSVPWLKKLESACNRDAQFRKIAQPASYVCSIILLLLCMLTLSSGTYNPFIYFRF